MPDMVASWTQDFLELAVGCDALRFGRFTLKSGRESPYFFNAGAFSDGASLDALARCYARAIMASGLAFDMLFGPAYKGIPLAAAIAVSLHRDFGRNTPFAFDRKEAKDHGEGGVLVGAPLVGRVLVIDDVITAGTAVSEVVAMIRAAGAELAGVVIGLNRQERGRGERSAIQEIEHEWQVPVYSIITLQDLIAYIEADPAGAALPAGVLTAMRDYRERYGVAV
jgi:orotate phosphoribosyltransferase